MSILIINIKGLVQVGENFPPVKSGLEMSWLPVIENAFLYLNNQIIENYGRMEDIPDYQNPKIINAEGKFVFPSFVDSHSHIVFAGSRENEFVDKIRGLTYQEIAKKGGGILNSAKLLGDTPEDELYRQSMYRVREVIKMGTGTLEIKSGYGLTLENELKMLRVARRIRDDTSLTIKTTFLGAHAVPSNENKEAYIKSVVDEMIPQVASERLADYCDVFCEEGFFTEEETVFILKAGQRYGLKSKVHANQLSLSGGVQAGVKVNAVSVDHLETIGKDEIQALKNSGTIATLLPGAVFFLRMSYPPVRDMLNQGLPVALASDYNPGSAPSGNMAFIISLGCIQMKMTPEEAINAATINGAYAMELSEKVGSITKGKLANVFITKPMSSYTFLPYAFGTNYIETVILRGELQ